MNQTQLTTTLGPILGLVAGYFAAWWGVDQATALGVVTAAVALIYSIYTAVITRKAGIISTVAAMPEVKDISLDRTAPNVHVLNQATPSNVTIK